MQWGVLASSLDATRLGYQLRSLWNLASASTELLLRPFKIQAIWQVNIQISRLRDFTRYVGSFSESWDAQVVLCVITKKQGGIISPISVS